MQQARWVGGRAVLEQLLLQVLDASTDRRLPCLDLLLRLLQRAWASARGEAATRQRSPKGEAATRHRPPSHPAPRIAHQVHHAPFDSPAPLLRPSWIRRPPTWRGAGHQGLRHASEGRQPRGAPAARRLRRQGSHDAASSSFSARLLRVDQATRARTCSCIKRPTTPSAMVKLHHVQLAEDLEEGQSLYHRDEISSHAAEDQAESRTSLRPNASFKKR